MFTIIDLIIGAVGIRLIRKYKKIRKIPDVVFVKKKLAFGGKTSYSKLLKLKVNTVIDLRAESTNEFIENSLIKYHKIGITDGGIPTKSQLDKIHKIIEENIKGGNGVFVHCNLGRGRATLATLSYLLSDGLDWESSFKMVRKRKFVYLNKKQINFLKIWYNEK